MTQEEAGFSIEALLVRQVKGLVQATADLIAESTQGDVLEIETQLFKLVAVNCEDAAKMAAACAEAEPEDLPAGHSEDKPKQ